MFGLPVIDTGDPELDSAFDTLMRAATAVRPVSITPGQARALLRVVADTETACGCVYHEANCPAGVAFTRIHNAGAVLLAEFFEGGNE